MIAVFRKMSASERRLALIAGACLVVAILIVGYLRAADRLNTMDATIEGLQQELLTYLELEKQAVPVNQAFDAMAAQHSSQWTQEEIHDRLRKEITRLALRDVPAPGSPIPSSSNPGSVLVSIPQMPMGSLVDSEDGYRSYQINFKIEPAPIQNIALFIERLQRSDQALRIDSLEIVRQPQANLATATMRVTRTVVDDVAGPSQRPEVEAKPQPTPEVDLIQNPGFEAWDAAAGAFPGWTAASCAIIQHGAQATEGRACLRAECTGPTGSLSQKLNLSPGTTYDLWFDAYAWGSARVQVVDGTTGIPFQGAQSLTADGSPYRYHLRFTVPGAPGPAVPILAPFVVLEGTGTVVLFDHVSLREATS